jgi:hypothetical protein
MHFFSLGKYITIKKAWKDVLQYNSVRVIKQKVQRIVPTEPTVPGTPVTSMGVFFGMTITPIL